MRLLLVTHYYPEHRGGVELVAGELTRRLVQNHGVECDWMASRIAPDVTENEDPGPPNIRRHPVKALNWSEARLGIPYPLWGPISIARLWNLVGACDVVHLHDALYMGNIAACLFAVARRKPVVVTQHIGMVPYRRWVMRQALSLANRCIARTVLGSADAVVFISDRVADYFCDMVPFKRQPHLVANGVDLKIFSPGGATEKHHARRRLQLADHDIMCLFVGRFVEKKGLPILRRLAASMPHVRWMLAGWGPENPNSWGCPNVTALVARTKPQLVDLYRAADLLVLPSVGEGFPLVVQEAMACGTPVLVSSETAEGQRQAIPYLFCEEVLPGDPDVSAQRWRARLSLLLQQRDALSEAGNRARTCAEQLWSWDVSTRRYAEILAAVVAGRSTHK